MTDDEVRSERHRFCPSCGTEAVEASSFCSECGGSLIKTGAQPSDEATANQTEASVDVAPTKKSRKWLWPVGVAVILLIAVVVIVSATSKSTNNSSYQAGYNYVTNGPGAAVIDFQLAEQVGLHAAAKTACNNELPSAGKSQSWINGCAAGLIHNMGPTEASSFPP